MNWNDLQMLLALHRGGSLAQAARLAGADKTTVSRRLAVLGRDLNTGLVERGPKGQLRLTDAGHRIAREAEIMEDQARAIANSVQADAVPQRTVLRLTAVPVLVHHVLVPNLQAFLVAQADIGVELIADARDLSLEQGEADIALRLARPSTGGHGVVARRIATLDYGVYRSVTAAPGGPWVGYTRAMQFLPPAEAVETAAAGAVRAPVAVQDADTLLHVVRAGLGQSVLPDLVAQVMPDLEVVPGTGVALQRELWVLVRRDMAKRARVRTVIAWLEHLFQPAARPD